jgi:hypothetical protein
MSGASALGALPACHAVRTASALGALAACLALGRASPTAAQPPAPPDPGRGSTSSTSGSVVGLARELAEQVDPASLASAASIAVGVACEVANAPRALALREALAESLAESLEGRAPHASIAVTPRPPAAPAELGAAVPGHGERAAVHVLVSMRARMVVADLTLLRASARGRATPPAARVLGRARIEAPLDAELAGYLGAPPPLRRQAVRARRAALPGAAYLAMVAADLDRDGVIELLLLSRDRVDALRVSRTRRGALRIAPLASAALASLPRAPARPRRPIGTLASRADGVVGRTSDHATPFAVRFDGTTVSAEARPDACPEGAYPLDDGTTCASAVLGRDYFHAELAAAPRAPAAPEAPAPRPALAGFYARAARVLSQRDGPPLDAEAIVTPRGRLVLSVGERRGALPDVGAALAIADLDADGTLEILTSGPGAVGEGDRLTLRRWGRALGTVYESPPLSGSVLAAATADLDGDGAEELLAIEEPVDASATATLWVLE